MLKTKLNYKRISRWVIRNQDRLSSDRMAGALLEDRNRHVWAEVKMRNVKTYNVPSVIDDVHGSAEIGDVFRDKYQQLHNSVSYDKGEMEKLLE